MTGRRERRCRKLLDNLKERRGYSHLKEEALACAMCRARFRRGFGPFVRQTTKWRNIHPDTISIYFTYLYFRVKRYSFLLSGRKLTLFLQPRGTLVRVLKSKSQFSPSFVPHSSNRWCINVFEFSTNIFMHKMTYISGRITMSVMAGLEGG